MRATSVWWGWSLSLLCLFHSLIGVESYFWRGSRCLMMHRLQSKQSLVVAYNSRWSSDALIDETRERFESAKVAITSATLGTILYTPTAAISGFTSNFSPTWQIEHISLSISLILFGLVYRYAVRKDGNINLKQGVVGAFLLTRTLSLVSNSAATITACHANEEGFGLYNCGAPFYLFDFSMLGEGIYYGTEALLAYGGLAVALEILFDKGWVSRFPMDREKQQ